MPGPEVLHFWSRLTLVPPLPQKHKVKPFKVESIQISIQKHKGNPFKVEPASKNTREMHSKLNQFKSAFKNTREIHSKLNQFKSASKNIKQIHSKLNYRRIFCFAYYSLRANTHFVKHFLNLYQDLHCVFGC